MWEAVASGAAGAISGAFGYFGQKEANKTNIQIAREQMDFQRDMSNTTWQRGVKDMQRAGINPMLAFSQGGASSPAGSAQSVDNANIGDAIGSGVTNAIEAARLKQELASADADIKVKKATERKIQEETNYVRGSAKLQALEYDPRMQEAQTRASKAIQDRDWQKVDKYMDVINKGLDMGHNAMTLANPVADLFGPRAKVHSDGGVTVKGQGYAPINKNGTRKRTKGGL